MIIVEIFNSLSMVFPLFALLKHRRKTKSCLKYVMYLHIPTSILFHAFKAFKKKGLAKIFFSIDIFFIQLSSLITSHEYRIINNTQQWLDTRVTHVLLYMKSLISNDSPVIRCVLIVLDNHELIHNKKHGKVTIYICGLSIGFYTASFKTRFSSGHILFHMMLYNVYDTYFKMIVNDERKILYINKDAQN